MSIVMKLNRVTMLRAFASANAQRLARLVEARLVCDCVLDPAQDNVCVWLVAETLSISIKVALRAAGPG
jgi:hypothetical protein